MIESDNKEILLTVEDLVRFSSVEANYIYSALSRGIWKSIKIKGKLYIPYSNIPIKTKSSLRDPKTNELLNYVDLKKLLDSEQSKELSIIIEQQLPAVTSEVRNFYQNYEAVKELVHEKTGEVIERKIKLQDSMANSLMRKWQFMSLLAKDFTKQEIAYFGFKTIKELREFVRDFAKSEGVKFASNYRILQNNIADFKRDGLESLISGNVSQFNRLKLGPDQEEFLEQLYGLPTKPSITACVKLFNNEAIKKGWKTISEACANLHLNKAEVRQRMTMARHGIEEFDNKYAYRISRLKVSHSNYLWVTDGTKVNYFYQKQGNTFAKLNCYAIIDAHSWFILGWKVLEHSEDSDMIREAFRDALKTTNNVMPREIKYDSTGKSFFGKIEDTLHFAAKANNAPSKIIERMFYELQRQVLKRHVNFTGQNITSKMSDSKFNKSLIQTLVKNGNLPSLKEAMQQAEMDRHIWNNLPDKTGKSPKQKYLEGLADAEGLELISKRDMACTFWTRHGAVTYRNIGLRTQIKGNVYIFEKVNELGEPDMDFWKNIGNEYEVRYDETDFSEIAIFDLKGNFVTFLKQKTLMPHAVADYKSGDRVEILKRMKLQEAQKAKTNKQIASLYEGMDVEERLKLGHGFLSKEVEDNALNDFYGSDFSTPVQEPEVLDLPAEEEKPIKKLNKWDIL